MHLLLERAAQICCYRNAVGCKKAQSGIMTLHFKDCPILPLAHHSFPGTHPQGFSGFFVLLCCVVVFCLMHELLQAFKSRPYYGLWAREHCVTTVELSYNFIQDSEFWLKEKAWFVIMSMTHSKFWKPGHFLSFSFLLPFRDMRWNISSWGSFWRHPKQVAQNSDVL